MKPNIILITIDSLRADHLGFMGYEKKITPNLDEFAKESAVFLQAYAVGPNTPNSFPGILTSTYPLDYQGPKTIERPRMLLSQVLKKAGYITCAIHSNPCLSNFFGYNQGWDFFEEIDISFFPNPSRSGGLLFFFQKLIKEITFSTFPAVYYWLRYLGAKYFKLEALKDHSISIKLRTNAEVLNRTIKDFINSIRVKKSPFFLWAHYMDVHAPYLPRECYFKKTPYTYLDFLREQRFPQHLALFPQKRALQKYMQKYREKGIELYDYGIEYIDYQIGELMNFLKNKNLYENSIIVITADHGDEFAEHGGGGHGHKLYNELLHVPLLIKIPGRKPERIEKKVSLINLPSTICNLLEITPPSFFKGGNLFAPSSNSLIFHQAGLNPKRERKIMAWTEIENINQCLTACQNREWKYILDCGSRKEELYHLKEDPKEQNNIAGKEPLVLEQMRKRIKRFEKENPPLSLISNFQFPIPNE